MMISRLTTRARTGRRMNRSVNFIGQSFSGLGASRNSGASWLSTTTGWPFRSLKTPVLTIVSPSFSPFVTATKSPRLSPSRTNCWRSALPPFPACVVDDEDRVAVGGVEHGRGRNGDNLFPDREADRRVDEHPGTELFLRVRHRRLQLDVPGFGVHQRVHRRDSTVDRQAGKSVARDPHRKADAQPGQFLLGEGEVDVDRVEGLERDDRITLAEDLAEVHLPDAQASAEGRADRLLGDGGAEGAYLGHRLLVIGDGGVVVRLGNDLLRQHLDVAREDGLRQFHLGLGAGELGFLHARVLADQQVAPLHLPPRLECDLHDLCRQLGGNGDPLDRGQRADRRKGGLPGFGTGHGGGNRVRRGNGLLPLLDHRPDLQGL